MGFAGREVGEWFGEASAGLERGLEDGGAVEERHVVDAGAQRPAWAELVFVHLSRLGGELATRGLARRRKDGVRTLSRRKKEGGGPTSREREREREGRIASENERKEETLWLKAPRGRRRRRCRRRRRRRCGSWSRPVARSRGACRRARAGSAASAARARRPRPRACARARVTDRRARVGEDGSPRLREKKPKCQLGSRVREVAFDRDVRAAHLAPHEDLAAVRERGAVRQSRGHRRLRRYISFQTRHRPSF